MKPRRHHAWGSVLSGLALVSLMGCTLPHTRVILPPLDMPSDETLGYHTEKDRHDIRLGKVEPIIVEHWMTEAFPMGQIRFTRWQGEYPFWTREWFPQGLPTYKGEHCAVQTYEGIKVEGGKYLEFRRNGWSWVPLEFFVDEQNAVRVKCDLDAVPSVFNMAGY